MKSRIEFNAIHPQTLQSLLTLQSQADRSGLDHKLMYLMKVRASQLNGCAYCIDMHTKDARAVGETEQRLYGLNAWREAPYYNDRERAALEWTEAITEVASGHVPDSAYEFLKSQFSESEIVSLTLVSGMINLWNRLVISMRIVPGTYKVGMFKQFEHGAAA